MKKYESVAECIQANDEAIENYKLLMNASAVIQFYAAVDSMNEKQAATLHKLRKSIIGNTSTQPADEPIPINPHNELKKIAKEIYRKVQAYRINSSEFAVEVFEEGLGFLEKLCKKHM